MLEQAFEPNQDSVVAACRGQLWRARTPSAGVHGRRRLLSEINVPVAGDGGGAGGAGGAAHTEITESVLGDTVLWEVLACVGYPLPKSFDVSSALGGLGHLQLSR